MPDLSLRASALLALGVAGCVAWAESAPVLPELVDKASQVPNLSGGEPRLKFVWIYNTDRIYKILERDSPATRSELRRRLADQDRPLATRLLYAGILADWNDRTGQAFLLERGSGL